jgi:hypothetical protein
MRPLVSRIVVTVYSNVEDSSIRCSPSMPSRSRGVYQPRI